MAFPNWLGSNARHSKAPSRISAPRSLAPRKPLEEISIEAGALRTAASADGRLIWATSAPMDVGSRVALKLTGVGKATFRVTGTVAGIRPKGDAIGMEVEVDEDQRGLVRHIFEHLAGGSDMPRVRPPRYRLMWPAVVLLPSGATYMNTVSVSAGGCGLSWRAARPRIGSVYYVRLGPQPSAACLRAMVSWVREAPDGVRVGFRFVGGETAKLTAILEQTKPGVLTE
jgi:hypothetical protein